MRTALPTLLAFLACLALSWPATAAAQDDEDELVKLNEKLQAAIAAMPRGIGLTPTSDDEAVQRIRTTLTEVKPRLRDHTDDERYPLVADNVKRLEAEEVALLAGHKAFAAIEEVRASHEASRIAGEAKLRAMAAAVTEFQRVTNPRWQPVAAGFGKFVATLRQAEQDLAQQNADAEREKVRAANEVRRAELAATARGLLDRVYLSLKAGERLPARELAGLKQAGDELQALIPGSGVFYLHEHARFSRIAQFDLPDPEAQQGLADALGATLVAQGTTPSKAFSVAIPATEGWCYLVVAQFAKSTGGEKLSGFTWTSKAGRGAIQPFALAEAERGVGLERGFCAPQGGNTVTAAAKLAFLGAKNGLRYAVLGWERARFPADLTLRLALDPLDPCDLPFWSSLWTQPVPGTLVWRGKEPFLLLDEEGRGLDVNGAPVALRVEELASKAPAAAEFTTRARFAGCGRGSELAWTADSRAFKACADPIEKRLQKVADPTQRESQWETEVRRKCAGPYAKVSLPAVEASTRIIEAYTAKAVTDPSGRVGALRARLGLTP